MAEDDFLADLDAAENHPLARTRPCPVCIALGQMSEPASERLRRALAGTIGAQKLADILTRNGFPASRRAVEKHKREGNS